MAEVEPDPPEGPVGTDDVLELELACRADSNAESSVRSAFSEACEGLQSEDVVTTDEA
jgi:hypothetical protein